MSLIYIIMALLAFGVLVFVHELGHFTLAKINKVKVEEFAIGMGPKIFSIQGKETQYSLRLFPIGGYVNMMGEEEAVAAEGSFSEKSPLRRISIIIAGVTMNYILAIVIFCTIALKFGYSDPIIHQVTDNSPAQESGLLEGDKILKVNDLNVYIGSDVSTGIAMAKGGAVNMLVERNGEEKEIEVTPKYVDVKDADGNIVTDSDGNPKQDLIVGVSFERVQGNFLGALKYGLNETKSSVYQTYKSLQMMVTGKVNFKTDVGGPVTIIKMSTKTAQVGIWNLIHFVGFISVNLAVMNLLPFPALDGGWTVILLIELITRKKIPQNVLEKINGAGFAILIGFMIIVTIKDILVPIKF